MAKKVHSFTVEQVEGRLDVMKEEILHTIERRMDEGVMDFKYDEKINLFGIPKGGTIVAGALAAREPRFRQVFDDSEGIDYVVDDIVDTGNTRYQWLERYPKPFIAMVYNYKHHGLCPSNELLNPGGLAGDKWVHFPWENETEPTDNVVRLLEMIGEDPKRDGLIDTPHRVCKAWKEMTAGYDVDIKELLSKRFKMDHDDMIISSGIRFTSLCEHHVLPFTGVCAVGYVPQGGVVVGLSKLARVVDAFSKRLQIQERLTAQIADSIEEAVQPRGVAVVMKAHHSCMGCRGANQPEAQMITSKMTGLFMEDEKAREEFLRLSGIRG